MITETPPRRLIAPAAPPPADPLGWGQRARLLGASGAGAALFVVALTLASLVLRTGQLSFHYWIDETISIGIASHPLSMLPALLRQDGSPPLYYALLHVWIGIFGSREVATHLLSLCFATIAIPVSYLAAGNLFGRRTGVFAAVLAAGLPFLTDYGQETRMYALTALESLVVSLAFVRAFVDRRRRWLPVFSVSLAAMLYTHNWALFFTLAAVLAFAGCAMASPRPRKALWRDGLLAFGAAALIFLPWLPTLLYQARHTGAPWAVAPVLWSLTQGLYFVAGGRGVAVALALAAGAGLVALRGNGSPRTSAAQSPSERRILVSAASLAVLSFGTLLIAWVYAKATPAWSGRYLAVIVGPLILLFALGLARARGLGVAALVLVCCLWAVNPQPSSPFFKSNVAAVAATIGERAGPATLVLATQPEQVPALAYYLPHSDRFASPLGLTSDPGVMDWRNALGRFRHSSVRSVLAPLISGLRPGTRVLLVTPVSFQPVPEWMVLIHRSSRTWARFLLHDRSLRRIAVGGPHAGGPGVNVRAQLFVVRAGQPAG